MHAYLDPGSTSMVLSLVASGVAGIVVLLKTFGHRLMSILTFWKRNDPKADEATEPTTDEATEPTTDEVADQAGTKTS